MKARIIGLFFGILLLATNLLADVPAPPSAQTSSGIDWTYVVMGSVAGILGAILFVWLGRRS